MAKTETPDYMARYPKETLDEAERVLGLKTNEDFEKFFDDHLNTEIDVQDLYQAKQIAIKKNRERKPLKFHKK